MITELVSDGGSSPPHSGEKAVARSAPCPILEEMPLVGGVHSWAKANTCCNCKIASCDLPGKHE